MPLPFLILAGAAVAGLVGVGAGINGAVNMSDANDTIKRAKKIQEEANDKLKRSSERPTQLMDQIGELELNTVKEFEDFSNVIELIQNRPKFNDINSNLSIPKVNLNDLQTASVAASAILGSLSGAGVGTAGGFAAAGVTTSAVMALGTASTGTAISGLSGVAATNAALAALGGGSLAAGGGGVALGTAVLGGATLGVGLLVGGVIFNIMGSNVTEKADKAYQTAKKNQEQVEKIVSFYNLLVPYAENFFQSFSEASSLFESYLDRLQNTVLFDHKKDWNKFTPQEKNNLESTILLVKLLYDMAKTQFYKKENDSEINKVNVRAIQRATTNEKMTAQKIQNSEMLLDC